MHVESKGTPSDIDVLMEFMEDAVTFDNYMDLMFILEDLFQKKVDNGQFN